jgi:S-disulfanyl-L-cysteine oxidoreductase SoxD
MRRDGAATALLVCFVAFAASLILVVSTSAQDSRSTWDGVYTAVQAGRGEPLYQRMCVRCHADDLSGEGHAPALAGAAFNTVWNNRPVAEFFDKVMTTMPPTSPGRLSPEETADVVAWILSKDAYPAGTGELPATKEALQAIRFLAARP